MADILGGLFVADQETEAPRPSTRQSKAEKEVLEDVEAVIGLGNMLAALAVGPEAQCSAFEQMLIEQGAVKSLAANKGYMAVRKNASPVFLLAGLGLWSWRGYMLWRVKHPASPRPPRPQGTGGIPRPGRAPQPFAKPTLENQAPQTTQPGEQPIPNMPGVTVGEPPAPIPLYPNGVAGLGSIGDIGI